MASKSQTQHEVFTEKRFEYEEVSELLSDPSKFFRCKLFIRWWNRGKAVVLDGEHARKKIALPTRDRLGQTFDGDIVVVQLLEEFHDGESSSGQVEGVLERCEDVGHKVFVCKADKNDTTLMCPIDSKATKFKLQPHCGLDGNDQRISILKFQNGNSGKLELKKKVKADDKKLFCVRYLKWSHNQRYPLGFVESVYSFDEHIFKKIYSVPGPFRTAVKTASNSLKQTVSGHCQDCTRLSSFTIDAANAKVFDDAFSIEKCEDHGDCWKIWIHITDVASVVPQNGVIDKDAKKRGVSFDTAVKGMREGQMFPPRVLSKCSLTKGGDDKYAVSVVFHSTLLPTIKNLMSDKGSPAEVMLTKIKIEENLTFGEAEKYLQTKQPSSFSESTAVNLYQKLNHLWKVFWSLRTKRLGPAALYHQMSLSTFSETSNELLARILVEEAMITTNSIFAKFLCDKSVQFIGRLQDPPDSSTKDLSSVWHASDLSIYQKTCCDWNEISASRKKLVQGDETKSIIILEEVKYAINAELISEHYEAALLLACCDDLYPSFKEGVMNYISMQERSEDYVHTCKNDCLAHFSLRLPCYLQSTSPLRRYVDLVNQRQIIAAVERRGSALPSDLCSQGGEKRFKKDSVNREEQVTNYKHTVDDFKFCSSLSTEKCYSFSAIVVQLHYGMLEIAWMNDKGSPSFNIKPQFLQATNRPSFEDGKVVYEWDLRYYDVGDGCGVIFDNELLWIIPKKAWKNFQDKLCEDIDLQNVYELGMLLKNILETLESRTNVQQDKKLTARTSNGIYHGRKFKLDVAPGSLIHFMALPSVQSFPPELVPEMLSLDEDFDVCLVHRHKMDVFPPVGPGKSYHASYAQSWMKLVVQEGRFCAVDDGNSIIFHNIDVTFEVCTGFFKLSSEFCKERFLRFEVGDLLCLRASAKEPSGKVGWVIHAVIKELKEKEMITVEFEYQTNSGYTTTVKKLKKIRMTCEFFHISAVYRRMLQALSVVEQDTTPEVVQRLCYGDVRIRNSHAIHNYLIDIQEMVDEDGLLKGIQLNDCQKEQICKALQQKITLIQGPPGTGKSVLGAHLAYYFWKMNKENQEDGKVLYCGPSNKSVDVVAGYLVKANLNEMRVVRVYATTLEEYEYPVSIKPLISKMDSLNSPNEKLTSISLHEIIRRRGPYAEEIKKFDAMWKSNKPTTLEQCTEYKNLIEKAKLHELNLCDVVLCTCSTAGSEVVSQLKFAQCIVDECGMCSEPETLIPVTASMSETLQIVLIGDHKQLSPIVKCKEARALTRSMFERLSQHANMLDTQYRMHDKICAFPSEQFYDGKLITAEEVRLRGNEFIYGQTPMQFFHIKGKELEEPDSYSKYNMEEVDVVNKIVMRLVAHHHIAPKRIMVLSPYLGQCNHLQKKLKKSFAGRARFHDLHIGSVVTSQGSEADYVIISTVRSHDVNFYGNYNRPWMFKHLGFVTDEHQINVAITRAKLGLYIVGNKDLLRVHPVWCQLLEHYQQNGAVREGFFDENEDVESVLGSDYDDYETDEDDYDADEDDYDTNDDNYDTNDDNYDDGQYGYDYE